MKENSISDCFHWSRRDFIRTGAVAGLTLTGAMSMRCQNTSKPPKSPKSIKINRAEIKFEREPLIRPFGFKGGFITEIWQTAILLESESGIKKVGLYNPSILWSDANVFAAHSETEGNELMYAMSERAVKIVEGTSFTNPVDLLQNVLDEVYEYGKVITNNPNLRMTFALNSLVGLDNAIWLLYAAENGISNFDEMIPDEYSPALAHRHSKVASIPLFSYNVPIEEIQQAVEQGYFFMKIKIGQPGTQSEMLRKDKERIETIHRTIGTHETPYTQNGKIPYYFDANGRYRKKETLMELLDHIRKIGAFDQIAIIEEPFPEDYEEDISDLGLRIAADESAHTDRDAQKRIQMGYKAFALKAIAKTLSMTLKIAKIAHENNVPCFCADLTVNSILIDWNKNVAARLAPFPGIGLGLLETNAHQNYTNWQKMKSYHPCAGASWLESKDGVFHLNDDFYSKSGGIFLPSEHYENLFNLKSD